MNDLSFAPGNQFHCLLFYSNLDSHYFTIGVWLAAELFVSNVEWDIDSVFAAFHLSGKRF